MTTTGRYPSISPFPASQGGLIAQPPLAIPRGTRLRGPSGSLRCSIYRGTAELGAAPLRHAAVLFPDKSALLARVNGELVRARFTSGWASSSPWLTRKAKSELYKSQNAEQKPPGRSSSRSTRKPRCNTLAELELGPPVTSKPFSRSTNKNTQQNIRLSRS